MARKRVIKQATNTVTIDRTRHVDDVPVIGWREWLGLPSLGVDRIKAKIDTGARTSALHAFDIKPFRHGGAPHVSFSVHPMQRHERPAIACTAPLCDQRLVRSSSGHEDQRYVVAVEVSLGDVTWPIELTLADRDPMGFRMLLGREAIKRRFLVDPERSFLIGRSFADVTIIFTHHDNKPRLRTK